MEQSPNSVQGYPEGFAGGGGHAPPENDAVKNLVTQLEFITQQRFTVQELTPVAKFITQNGLTEVPHLVNLWPQWKVNHPGFVGTMAEQLPHLFNTLESMHQHLQHTQQPFQQAAHVGQPAAFPHPPAAPQPPQYISQMVQGVAGGSMPAAVGYPQHPPPAQPPIYQQPPPQQAPLPPALPPPSAAAWASPVVAESAPVPNADPTPAETMLMNQTVEQYMASLVSKLHLDADPSGLAHTLESELGITSMEELQDAAEQLPYVLDDSFPREILEELIPKPTFEVMNWHAKLGPRRENEEPTAPPWPTHCYECTDPLTGRMLFCSTCGTKVPEPQLPQASTEIVPRLCRWDNDGGLGVNRGIQGGNNSCYMDAVMFSLFVTTASLDHQMSKLLQGSDQAAADAVKLLVDLVVAPLRTTLYVSSSQVLNWREYMQRYMPDSSTDIRDENDACEYGQILLEKVLLLEDLVRLRPDPRTHISGKEARKLKKEEETRKKKGDANGVDKKADATTTPDTKMPEMNPHTNTFERHQSSLALMPMDGQREVTTTAALLKHTLQGEEPSGQALGGEFVFHNPPAVLMLQMPRHGSYDKAYERIFPSERVSVPVTTKDPNTYKKNALPLVTSVSMKLRAVVCIQQSHYVAYARMPVNKGGEGSRRWVFSDSMADNRKASTGGFESLPCTLGCPGVDKLYEDAANLNIEVPGAVEAALARSLKLGEEVVSELEALSGDTESVQLTVDEDMDRLMKDAYVCLYELEQSVTENTAAPPPHLVGMAGRPQQQQPKQQSRNKQQQRASNGTAAHARAPLPLSQPMQPLMQPMMQPMMQHFSNAPGGVPAIPSYGHSYAAQGLPLRPQEWSSAPNGGLGGHGDDDEKKSQGEGKKKGSSRSGRSRGGRGGQGKGAPSSNS